MTEVLFITTERPPLHTLDDVAETLRTRHGAVSRLAIFFDPEDIADSLHLEEIHRVQVHLSQLGGKPVRRFTPRWFWLLVRNPLARMRLRRADKILRPWLMVKNDPWVRRRAADADVIVAVDANAVYCVWELAQINTTAHAVRGLYESLEVLTKDESPGSGRAEVAGSAASAESSAPIAE
ncbi:MAG TPA: hypothetical protein VK028_12470 [Micromonosporaceae bacterium]|uniref:hypothetical protein n=1 Tax=Haloactinopolyspora sp. TaxID=1966353 RepID=UPI002631C34B|nr:hypothetical protein [Haloactinopolyspora sp.]HLT11592.1 hypothetical protein [Micromonosporaceae bacterium]